MKDKLIKVPQIKKLMKTRKNTINMMISVFSIAVVIFNVVFITQNKKIFFKDTLNIIMYILVNVAMVAIICVYYFSNRNKDKNFITKIESLNEKDKKVIQDSYENPIIKSKTLNMSKLGLIGINRNGCVLINYTDIKKVVLTGTKYSYSIRIYTEDDCYCYDVESLEDLKILKNKIKAKSGCEIQKTFNLGM